MAQSLEGRVAHLKLRLEGLRRLYSNKERPLAVDLEIQVLKQQIENLTDLGTDQGIAH